MRPVMLKLNGFASFRDRTVVDFTDADYFSLIGPTGAGKSTILDAISFALYGTAPRWNRANGIAMALAPTTNQCTVSLVFDVGSERYEVAREIRRAGKDKDLIQQKNVSLVRYTDSTLVETTPDGAQPETITGETKQISVEVERILGLSFDDFCQCVMLPQGEFATFLKATSGDRQKTLLKLLGAEDYELMAARANKIANEADVEAGAYRTTSERDADVDAAQVADADGRAVQVADLAVFVRGHVQQAREVSQRVGDLTERSTGFRRDLELLAAISEPAGVADISEALVAATTKAQTANADVDTAEKARDAAAAAADQAPKRHEVEAHVSAYERRAQLAADLVSAEAQVEATAAALAQAETARAGAEATVEARQQEAAAAHQSAATAGAEVSRLSDARAKVADVREPANLRQMADAAREEEEARRALQTQHGEVTEQLSVARAALAGQANVDRLGVLERDTTTFERATTNLQVANTHLADTKAQLSAAEEALAGQRAALAQADVDLEHARNAAASGRLRSTLEVGHACPVCEQQVATLPAPADTDALEQAQSTQRDAKQGEAAAANVVADLLRQIDGAQGDIARWQEQLAELDDAFTARLHDIGTEAMRREIAEAHTSRSEAEQTVVDLETRLEAIVEHLRTSASSGATAHLSAARDALLSTHARVRDLEAPDVDGNDLLTSWERLSAWAAEKTVSLTADLDTAAERSAALSQLSDAANAQVTAAQGVHETALAAHTGAVRDAAQASTHQQSLAQQAAKLDETLAAAPAADTLPGLLEQADTLSLALSRAGDDARQARTAQDAANRERQVALESEQAARRVLNAARFSVAAMAPPESESDLLTSWAQLTSWAGDKEAERSTALAATERDADAARTELDGMHLTLNERVGALLGEEDLGDEVVDTDSAERLVSGAAVRARSHADALAAALARFEDATSRMSQALEREQVARMLAGLLNKRGFQKWLAESAMDTLVVTASESLRLLSNDQYDLTHENGDFFVIDHSDADAKRSVRTLSGGETFQTSLALALALSSQLAALGGGTRLESIFLDEGFGTLDADALETVAGTLENLAQGERMVGVITHVGQLAERAPVRYRVRRDSRTSTIVRE